MIELRWEGIELRWVRETYQEVAPGTWATDLIKTYVTREKLTLEYKTPDGVWLAVPIVDARAALKEGKPWPKTR